jgi:malonyl CoA-acyl carrier protein transacylase
LKELGVFMGILFQFGSFAGNTLPFLRELYKREENKAFFKECKKTLEDIKEYLGNDKWINLLPSGFNLDQWLNNSNLPDRRHLESSLIMVTCTHIYHLCLLNAAVHVRKLELPERPDACIGHSVGLQAAVLASLHGHPAQSKLAQNSIKFIFLSTARGQDAYTGLGLKNELAECVKEHSDSVPGPMLSITNIDRTELEGMVNEFNKSIAERSLLIQISLINAPNLTVVSGQTSSLVKFVTAFKSRLTTDNCKLTFLKHTAPFHSDLLAASREGFELDRGFIGYDAQGHHLMTPVYTTSRHTNLQHSRDLYMDLFDQIILKQVDWVSTVVKTVERHGIHLVVDFGPGSITKFLTQESLLGYPTSMDYFTVSHRTYGG